MVNAFNVVVAVFRLSVAMIMLFAGIALILLNPKLIGGSNPMPVAIYVGILLLISGFVLGVISVENKPVPGPPGPQGPIGKCLCEHCSNFNVEAKSIEDVPEELIEEHVALIQKSTLKDL